MRVRWRGLRTKHSVPIGEISGFGRGGGAIRVAGRLVASWDPKAAVDQGIDADPVLFAGADALASALARPKVLVDGREDHPLAERLNRRANSIEDASQFRYRQAMQLLTSTKGVFTLHDPDWTEIVLLDPQLVTPIIEGGKLQAYRLESPGGDKELPPELVVWHKRPHPYDLVRSLAPVGSAAMAVDASTSALAFLRRWFVNDGGTRALIVLEEEIDEQDVMLLKQRLDPSLRAREEATGRVDVIAGTRASVHDLSPGSREVRYNEIREALTDDVLLALRTPRSVAGDASGRTFANAAAEQAIWWEWTVEPLLRLLAAGWSAAIDAEVEFVTSDLPAVQRAQEDRAQGLAVLVSMGILSPQEARERLGLPPRRAAAQEGEEQSLSKVAMPPEEKLARVREAAEKAQDRRIAPVRKRFVAAVNKAEELALSEVRRHTEAARKKQQLPIDWEALRLQVRELLGEALAEALFDVMMNASRSLAEAAGARFAALRAERIAELVEKRVVPLMDLTAERPGVPLPQRIIDDVRAAVQEGIRAGEGTTGIAERVMSAFTPYKTWEAERIARTETLASVSVAEFETAKAADVIQTKTWLTVGDDRVRDTHAELEGFTTSKEEDFVVGGYPAPMPRMTGVPEEDINCRCEVLWHTGSGEEIEQTLERNLVRWLQ